MTRYDAFFTVAVRDNDEEGLQSFRDQLQRFVDENIPAMSGWAKVTDPRVIEISSDNKDPEGW